MEDKLLSAKSVSEHLLQVTGDALKTGDFEKFAACFTLPHMVETFEKQRFVETKDHIREIFECSRRYFDAHNITDLDRTCVAAEFRDTNTITSTHISRLLSGSRLFHEPYPVFMILKRTEDGWKISDGKYAVPEASRQLWPPAQDASRSVQNQDTQSA